MNAGEVVVEASKVWKLFQIGDEIIHALSDVSVSVRRGEFVCLMGPSGSGKSTLLNTMGGLDRPTKGSIEIEGRPTGRLTEAQFSELRHSRIGFIFQSFNLIPFLTAVENVELPLIFEPVDRGSLRERAMALLGSVGLEARSEHRPHQLSAGEQQRTAIARALIGSPSIILADEPTANLDRKAGGQVLALLQDLRQRLQLSVVTATHDDVVAREGSRVLIMEDGRVVDAYSNESMAIDDENTNGRSDRRGSDGKR